MSATSRMVIVRGVPNGGTVRRIISSIIAALTGPHAWPVSPRDRQGAIRRTASALQLDYRRGARPE